jgi:hypothetical protein
MASNNDLDGPSACMHGVFCHIFAELVFTNHSRNNPSIWKLLCQKESVVCQVTLFHDV